MVRLLLAICFLPCAVMATPSMHTLLINGDFLKPIVVMKQLEQQDKGTICDFDVEVEEGLLVYKISMVDVETRKMSKYQYRALDGVLLNEKTSVYSSDDIGPVNAAKMLQAKQMTFSALVALAIEDQQGYLTQAELDHDLSISYLELKLLNQDSKNTIAFDIETLRPLPLLKWD
ncbi:hypothetical protein K8B83_02600 [Shewanella inventionis]|nr:hypothetical protein [Shewanella inventionis]MCL1159142.1 hypothetical protein [Shewanella inventionis]UAL43795.1 hypothetical protein K8B83_02600 [Shewanella inventionis]